MMFSNFSSAVQRGVAINGDRGFINISPKSSSSSSCSPCLVHGDGCVSEKQPRSPFFRRSNTFVVINKDIFLNIFKHFLSKLMDSEAKFHLCSHLKFFVIDTILLSDVFPAVHRHYLWVADNDSTMMTIIIGNFHHCHKNHHHHHKYYHHHHYQHELHHHDHHYYLLTFLLPTSPSSIIFIHHHHQ